MGAKNVTELMTAIVKHLSPFPSSLSPDPFHLPVLSLPSPPKDFETDRHGMNDEAAWLMEMGLLVSHTSIYPNDECLSIRTKHTSKSITIRRVEMYMSSPCKETNYNLVSSEGSFFFCTYMISISSLMSRTWAGNIWV